MTEPSYRRLTLRHLRLLSVLGTELSVRRTAELLHTSPSALSRSLGELEEIVGARLFDRTTKRVSPTAAGTALLHHARRVLAEVEGAQRTLAGIQHGVRGALRIGAIPAICPRLLACAIGEMAQLFPDLQVSVTVAGLTPLYEGLLATRFDTVMAPVEMAVDSDEVQVEEVYTETVVVLAARNHPLASVADVSAYDMAAHPWVLPPPDLPMRPWINRMLALHRTPGAPAIRDVETGSFALGLELARHCGMLCTIPVRLAPGALASGLVALQWNGNLLTGPMASFRLRKSTAAVAADAFVRCVRVAAQRESRPRDQ